MSLYGNTKGTELEAMVEQFLKAEARGAVLYCALARLAMASMLQPLKEAAEQQLMGSFSF